MSKNKSLNSTKVISQFLPLIHNFLRKKGCLREDANDIAQEVVIKIYLNINKYQNQIHIIYHQYIFYH